MICQHSGKASLKRVCSRKGVANEVFNAQKIGQWCTVFCAIVNNQHGRMSVIQQLLYFFKGNGSKIIHTGRQYRSLVL